MRQKADQRRGLGTGGVWGVRDRKRPSAGERS